MPKNTGRTMNFIYEVRLLKTQNEKRPWRWDVIVQKPTEGPFPGVYDRRMHMSGSSGYARTKIGARYKIAKKIDTLQRFFPIA